MFEPISLNGQQIKNRIVRSATRDYLFHADGTVSDDYVAIYEELARNEVGLIICGFFRNDDRYTISDPQGSVDGDNYVAGLARIAQAVHPYGSVLYGQMGYTGTADYGQLTDVQIEAIAQQYIKGAITMQKAGFDGVQVHMAHGNFLCKLLAYDLEGHSDDYRLALPLRIVWGIKVACGPAFTVIGKINANDVEQERLLYYVKQLYAVGLDAIEISGKDWSIRERADQLYYLETAKAIKAQVGIPVILVGGLHSTETLQKALKEGMDLVSLCRSLICEPDFVRKLQQGNAESKCIRCSQCLTLPKSKYKRCVFGPEHPFLKEAFMQR